MTDPGNIGRIVGADDEFEQERSDAADDRSRMSFLEHLDELRKRILYSIYAIVAACLVTFAYWDDLFTYLATYFQSLGGELIYSRPMGAFLFNMKTGVLAGLLLASPFVFSQVWLFVAPGLYAKEKKVVVPFVILSNLLFGAGAYFAHVLGFPAMWKFLASYNGMGGVKFLPTIDETFSFYAWTILGLGAVFQMPMLVYFLARFGIISARFMVRHIKYALLIIVVLAAVITPSGDVVTLTVFAAPMLVLYVVSIGVAWVFGKKRKV